MALAEAPLDTLGASPPASRPFVPPAVPIPLLPRLVPDTVAAQPPTRAVDPADLVPRLVEYLWVVRTSMLGAADIDLMLARASEMRVRGLLVQVVGRGDAFYRSDVLPRSEALARPAPGDTLFDPLGYLMPRARAAGLEVHAWMNSCLVWSAPHRPRSPTHVVNAHPEWVARTRDGRSMARLTARERERLGLEGIYLSPAHPGVKTWVAKIAQEIARRYDVDGIHLDYIRQPSVEIGYDETTRARFALDSGVDIARPWTVPRERRADVNAAWREFQSEQVTAIVREVRDSLATVRADVTLSAAVLADTITAERFRAQAWRMWVRAGLVDRAFVMSYAPSVQKVLDQLVGFADVLGASDRVVPGIAVYNSSASAAAAKIKAARSLGYPVLALYSYDSLFHRPEYWFALRGFLDVAAPVHP